MLKAGVPPAKVQQILRHKDIRTTLNTYMHLTVDDLREGLKALPTIAAPEAKLGADFYPNSTRPLQRADL
jgi:hypothetical protein